MPDLDENTAPPIEVHSIMVSEGAIEISYADEADVGGGGVMMIRTIVVPRALIEEEMAEFFESVQTIVDAGLVAKRLPPTSFRRPR